MDEKPLAKKSVCIRIPLSTLSGVDTFGEYAGLNRTDSMIDLLEKGLTWARLSDTRFSKVWERRNTPDSCRDFPAGDR
jgi:hypothetical protein